MDEAMLTKSWLQTSLIPSIVLVEGNDSEFYENSCNLIDPLCENSLLRLLDLRKGSKRTIEYLTPSGRMSQLFKVRVLPSLDHGPKNGRSLDNSLYQAVASQKPDN